MAQIKQVGIGRKSTGTIDGITYYVRGGVTYARSTPNMPASVYRGNGSPSNRYYSLNKNGLAAALDALAELYVAGQDVTITDVEQAISDYATEHPTSIKIASKSGYNEVFLTGEWPSTITLNALSGDSTIIIIVAENGTTTTINADGTTTVSSNSGNSSESGNSGGSSTGGNASGPSAEG